MMKKWYHILWGSKEEDELVKEQSQKSPDPADLTIENAYKTRWIWYHTFMACELLIIIILLIGILIKI